MKYLIDPMDLSVEEIDELIDIANDIIKDRTRYQDVCRHKILATLFFEPSTRTRLYMFLGIAFDNPRGSTQI